MKAREDFRASKQQDVFSLVSAIGGEKKKGPAMKLAFGKGNVSLSRIVNQGSGKLLGKAGVHHLHLGPTRQRLAAAVYLRFGSALHLPTRRQHSTAAVYLRFGSALMPPSLVLPSAR